MATAVAIQLTLDDKGVITGLRSVGSELDKFGDRGSNAGAKAAQGIHLVTREQERGAQASNLFARGLGIELPRQIEKLIGQSKLIGPAMATAFNVGVVVVRWRRR
jgi:hypothetical protein